MPEYIEKEALLAHLEERGSYLFKENGDYDHYTNGFDEAYGRVENFETIDAVPVIRCVNCVHFGAEAIAFDAWAPYCLKHKLTVFPDDFCSYGERKGG